uniref:THAP-type domain-containing protein n=1 Tax=Lepeophtheirus salmonis TaxID=72036 RepID=A0A0K2URN8_LEPSM
MTSSCVVSGCSRRGSFQFPSNEGTFINWRIALSRKYYNGSLWRPSTYSVLCEKHFKPKDFRVPRQTLASVGGKAYRYLKRDVVPSLLPWLQRSPSTQE